MITTEQISRFMDLAEHCLEGNYPFGHSDWTHTYNDHNDYNIYTGASKAVLVLRDDSEWVIKIPFRGDVNDGEHTDCSGSCPSNTPCAECYKNKANDEESDAVIDFTKAKYTNKLDRWNYCESEVNIYAKAKELGLEDFFAETIKIGETSEDHPVYVQKKVSKPSVYSGKEVSKEQRETTDKVLDTGVTDRYGKATSSISLDYASLMLDYYGLDRFVAVMNFLNDLKIGDFHGDNLGFTEDNQPVLFDYSGFFEGHSSVQFS